MRLTYIEAIAKALYDAAEVDKRVLMIGAHWWGLTYTARPLFEPIFRDFSNRVLVPEPVSELGMAGAGIGAALAGCRPIVGLSTGSFIFEAYPQVVNEAPNIHYMTGGHSRVPVTFYSVAGLREHGAAQHSHSPQAMLANTPGLQILLPASPADAYHLLKWALLESENPTWFHSHPLLFDEVEEVDLNEAPVPIGKARIRREGTDVSIIATSSMVPRSIRAAEILWQEHGVSAEIVDLRTIAPLDSDTMLRSVEKTGRAVIADECHKHFGVSAELAAILAEDGFSYLKTAVRRAATPHVPIPYSPVLEQSLIVTPAKIVAEALHTVQR